MPTKLLVRTKTGYVTVGTGADWGYLELGNTEDPAVATEIATATLAAGGPAEPNRASIAAGLEPRNANDTPYTNIELGDAVRAPNTAGTLTTYRTVGVTVTEDTDGHPIWALELNALLDEAQALQRSRLNRMVPGTLGGHSTAANPSPDLAAGIPTGKLEEIPLDAFSQPSDSPVVLTRSGKLPFPKASRLYKAVATLKTAGTSSTVVRLYRDGSGTHFDELTIPSSSVGPERILIGGQNFTANQYAEVAATTAGAGALGLTVKLYATTAV